MRLKQNGGNYRAACEWGKNDNTMTCSGYDVMIKAIFALRLTKIV